MAAPNVENSLRIVPLSESNYAAWANTMKLCLRSIGTWCFIEGAVETPKDADASLFYRTSTIIASRSMVSSMCCDFAFTMKPVEMPSTLLWSPFPLGIAGRLK